MILVSDLFGGEVRLKWGISGRLQWSEVVFSIESWEQNLFQKWHLSSLRYRIPFWWPSVWWCVFMYCEFERPLSRGLLFSWYVGAYCWVEGCHGGEAYILRIRGTSPEGFLVFTMLQIRGTSPEGSLVFVMLWIRGTSPEESLVFVIIDLANMTHVMWVCTYISWIRGTSPEGSLVFVMLQIRGTF